MECRIGLGWRSRGRGGESGKVSVEDGWRGRATGWEYWVGRWHESTCWLAEWKAGCCNDEIDPVVGLKVLWDNVQFCIPGEPSRVRFRHVFERWVAEV